MALIVTTTVGLVIWVVLWAMGVKGSDAIMITITMVVVAAMGRVVATRPENDR